VKRGVNVVDDVNGDVIGSDLNDRVMWIVA